mmetsp:Transcript_11518/g.29170  ORF Transcript_11518/g.29170 Transcript_11518/m.29170 type:complete len:241 (+) Transcript_11518:18-740(+)
MTWQGVQIIIIKLCKRSDSAKCLWQNPLQFAGSRDEHLFRRLPRGGAHPLHLLDHVHSFEHLAQHHVLAVEVRGGRRRDEELRPVGVGSGVGHAQRAGPGVLAAEVLVLESLAVDRLAAGAVAVREVAALDHELGDDSVEGRPLEVEGLALAPLPLLTRAQRAEVLHGAGDLVPEEAQHDAASRRAPDRNVQEDLVRDRLVRGRRQVALEEVLPLQVVVRLLQGDLHELAAVAVLLDAPK